MNGIRAATLTVAGLLLAACGSEQAEPTAESQPEKKAAETEVAQDFEILLTAEGMPEGTRVYIYETPEVEKAAKVDQLSLGDLVDGKYRHSGTVKDVRYIWLDLIPADSKKPLSRLHMMLEPGTTTVHYFENTIWNVHGGPYNDLLVSSYLNNQSEYWDPKFAASEYRSGITKQPKDMSLEERRELNQKLREIRAPSTDLRKGILEDILHNHPDPVARLGAYRILPLTGNSERLKFLAEIKDELSDHRGYKAALWKAERSAMNAATSSNIKVGTVVPDFTAKDLEGKTFNIADVRKNNKYVLVEFWASWCGPCRGEIPHMKEAYAHFKDKGFEIVSFSLDDSREDWEDASLEEELPWPNTSDLLAYSGPIAKLYGVSGIPKNYLVDAATGEIVAMNLRQKALDEKLEELLGSEAG